MIDCRGCFNMKASLSGARRLCAVLFAAVTLSACATTASNPADPFESYNRAMFSFNEEADRYVLKPLAQAYDAVTPQPLRAAIGNFFGNLADVWIGANNLLQGKPAAAISDWMRVVFNSTLGLFGTIDLASDMGLPKHAEDFGQTLGVWGVGSGNYLVLPLLGPSTVRDTAALPVDYLAQRPLTLEDVGARNATTVLRLTHTRAGLLGADKTLEQGTLDKYAYIRDFYLQQRQHKIFDGSPPLRYENYDE